MGHRNLGKTLGCSRLLCHATSDEPRSGAPDFGLGDPGVCPLLAHRFLDQLINSQRVQFAVFDVTSSPRANLPCRFPDERIVHEELLRSNAVSNPRSKRLDEYSAEID
jgi:endonuclease YncB( thermonuclease family)